MSTLDVSTGQWAVSSIQGLTVALGADRLASIDNRAWLSNRDALTVRDGHAYVDVAALLEHEVPDDPEAIRKLIRVSPTCSLVVGEKLHFLNSPSQSLPRFIEGLRRGRCVSALIDVDGVFGFVLDVERILAWVNKETC